MDNWFSFQTYWNLPLETFVLFQFFCVNYVPYNDTIRRFYIFFEFCTVFLKYGQNRNWTHQWDARTQPPTDRSSWPSNPTNRMIQVHPNHRTHTGNPIFWKNPSHPRSHFTAAFLPLPDPISTPTLSPFSDLDRPRLSHLVAAAPAAPAPAPAPSPLTPAILPSSTSLIPFVLPQTERGSPGRLLSPTLGL